MKRRRKEPVFKSSGPKPYSFGLKTAVEMFVYRRDGRSIEDIADLCGVSQGTVSLTLNRRNAIGRAAWRQLTAETQKMFEAEHFTRQVRRRSKLTPAAVRAVWHLTRVRGLSPTKVARRMGIEAQVVYTIASGRTWHWLTSRLPGNDVRPPWLRPRKPKEVISGD